MLSAECWVQGAGCRVQGAGCWVLSSLIAWFMMSGFADAIVVPVNTPAIFSTFAAC